MIKLVVFKLRPFAFELLISVSIFQGLERSGTRDGRPTVLFYTSDCYEMKRLFSMFDRASVMLYFHWLSNS